ncbi:MAG: acetyltransferase [Bacteroidota bacterium]
MKDIVIYGAGGLGKEMVCLIEQINQDKRQWNLLGFVDDSSLKKSWFGLPVLGDSDFFKVNHSVNVVVAIGHPAIKKQIAQKVSQCKFPTLIHPSSQLMSKNIELASGTVLTAGTVLTCDIKLGCFSLVNLNTTIGHDTEIGDYSSIMCGVNIAGGVRIGECSFVGSGTNIINQVQIGNNVKIGAGAVVIRNIEDDKTAVGVPAQTK